MSPDHSLIAYIAAATLLTLTPGVDTALVLRTAAMEGPRAAWNAGVGIVIGCLAWGAAVAIGLGGLVAASETGYTLLKWLGAAYLVWLGIKMIVKPRSAAGLDAELSAQAPASRAHAPRAHALITRGLLTNLLNPKIGVFYVSFLPQFVPQGAPVGSYCFLLAVIHALLGLAWFALLIMASVPIARVLRRPRTLAIMDRVTGCLFLVFGAKLALSRR